MKLETEIKDYNPSWKEIKIFNNLQEFEKFSPTNEYEIPAIYRWKFKAGDLEEVYIGETSNLKRRFGQYKNPGAKQLTNIRLSAIIKAKLKENDEVDFEVLEFSGLRFNENLCLCLEDMNNKYARVLLENLIILQTRNDGCEVLNLNIP